MFFLEKNVKIENIVNGRYDVASIKEAYDSTIGESFTGLKLILWAIPLFICRGLFLDNNFGLLTVVGSVFGLLLIGFLTESAHNTIAKKSELIPGINLLSMAWTGIKTILAMAMSVGIAYILNLIIAGFVKIEDPTFHMTIDIFVWFFVVALPVSTYLIYIRRLNVFEAFNLKKIFVAYGEAFLAFAYLVVQMFIIALIVVGFITYMFWLFVGLDNAIINFIWCIAVMYNLTVMANYLAQLSEEIFTFREKEEIKKTTY